MSGNADRPESEVRGIAWRLLVAAAMRDRHPDPKTDKTTPGMSFDDAERYVAQLPAQIARERAERLRKKEGGDP